MGKLRTTPSDIGIDIAPFLTEKQVPKEGDEDISEELIYVGDI